MDIGPVPKVSAVAASPSPTLGATASAASVRTELPPSAVVQQASATANADNEQRQAAGPIPRAVERQLTIDPSTRVLVSKVLDERSGDLLSQVPDIALLRVKSYAREMVAAIDAKQSRTRLERTA